MSYVCGGLWFRVLIDAEVWNSRLLTSVSVVVCFSGNVHRKKHSGRNEEGNVVCQVYLCDLFGLLLRSGNYYFLFKCWAEEEEEKS